MSETYKTRPVVKATAGKYPIWSRGTTLIDIQHSTGACQLEVRELSGSLMIRLYGSAGKVHLCAPLHRSPHGEAIWSRASDFPPPI